MVEVVEAVEAAEARTAAVEAVEAAAAAAAEVHTAVEVAEVHTAVEVAEVHTAVEAPALTATINLLARHNGPPAESGRAFSFSSHLTLFPILHGVSPAQLFQLTGVI